MATAILFLRLGLRGPLRFRVGAHSESVRAPPLPSTCPQFRASINQPCEDALLTQRKRRDRSLLELIAIRRLLEVPSNAATLQKN